MLKTIPKGLELDGAENAALNEYVAILDKHTFDLVTPDICHRESI